MRTTIRHNKSRFIYYYDIRGGLVQFSVKNNNYYNVWSRGIGKTLAEAVYKACKSISSSYLKGRTISGIHVELFIHWALYTVRI